MLGFGAPGPCGFAGMVDTLRSALEMSIIPCHRGAQLHTVDAALASAVRIEKLLGRARAEALRDRLVALDAAEPTPGSLGEWARELIGRASASEANRRLRVLVGLDPLPDSRRDTSLPAARTVAETAEGFGVEAAQDHSSLQFCRPTAPGLVQRSGPDAQRAAAFQDQLDRGMAAGRFRVVQVVANDASHATDALAAAPRTQPISLDHTLAAAPRTQPISLDHTLAAAIAKTAAALGVEWTNKPAARPAHCLAGEQASIRRDAMIPLPLCCQEAPPCLSSFT